MAVDSQAKRFAMLTFGNVIVNLLVVDAAVSTEDRISNLGLYNGFALDPPLASDPYGWYSPYRRRRVNNSYLRKGR